MQRNPPQPSDRMSGWLAMFRQEWVSVMMKWLISALTANRICYYGPKAGRRIYLTFDDGPNPTYTEPLLDLLEEHGVRATFFLIGQDAYAHQDIVKRIVDRGHILGNHSITHPRMDFLSDAARDIEIDGVDDLLSEFDGNRRHSFRPPFGGISVSLFAYSLRFGRQLAMWSLDSLDHKFNGSQVVAHLTARPPKAGDILLFHDDGVASIESLRVLLPQWIARGFTFGTFGDLAPR